MSEQDRNFMLEILKATGLSSLAYTPMGGMPVHDTSVLRAVVIDALRKEVESINKEEVGGRIGQQ